MRAHGGPRQATLRYLPARRTSAGPAPNVATVDAAGPANVAKISTARRGDAPRSTRSPDATFRFSTRAPDATFYSPLAGNVVDNTTIQQHLLNETSDPFSRQPLSPEEVAPLPELKQRIAAWLAEKRAERRAARG